MYDPACEELARHFLSDRAPARLCADLSQTIQDAVEDWLTDKSSDITDQIQQMKRKPS